MFINQPQPSSMIPLAPFNATTPLYNLNISATGLFALQLYAFGGLAFMICVVFSALGLWVRTVVINREWANSPPDIELHPEVSNVLTYLSFFLKKKPLFKPFF